METRIKQLCLAAGITTSYQLQKKTGFSPSQADRLFNDKVEAISLSVLEKLCETFGTNPNAIFGYDVPETAKVETVMPEKKKPVKRAETEQTTVIDGDYLTTAQVAERLGINERTVRDNYTNGKLPFVKIGTKNFVRPQDLEVFEASRKAE